MELDQSDIERIVRLIVAELTRSREKTGERQPAHPHPFHDSRKTVLVLYSPILKGLEEAWDQLRLLDQEGYNLIHILSPEVHHLISPEQIKSKFQSTSTQVFSSTKAQEEIKGITFQTLVGGTLSRAEAAKIALAQTDTFFSDMVFQMLWHGRPVVLVRDGVMEPNFRDRPRSAAMAGTVEAYLRRLADYGARLVMAKDLASAVRETLLLEGESAVLQEQKRTVITAQDIEEAEQEVVVKPGTIVTPLAWDVAKHRGIAIRREQG